MSDKKGYEAYNTESKEGMKKIMSVLSWAALIALIAITAVHAVSIVMRHHGSGTGILYWLRVAAPIMTEVFTALVTLGFALHLWRGVQQWLGLSVEIIWILFASLNLMSDFTMEGGGVVGGALGYWINYGLPVSAVVTGVLFYFTLKSSPENRRIEGEKAAESKRAEDDFTARQGVYESPEFAAIQARRAWIDIVNGLKRDGYDDHEIDFMLQRQPQLAGYVPSETVGRVTIEGQSAATADTPTAARPAWRDRVFGRPAQATAQPAPQEAGAPASDDAIMATIAQMVAAGQLVIPVAQQGNSTHSGQTQSSQSSTQFPTQSAPGQGNGPAAKPLGRDAQNPTSRQ